MSGVWRAIAVGIIAGVTIGALEALSERHDRQRLLEAIKQATCTETP